MRRSLNDAMIADAAAAKQETTACHPLSDPPQAVELSISSASSGSEEDSSPRSSSPIQNSERHGSIDVDDDMPDVEVREAGFAPTGDQPFRRARRHTIA